MSDYDADEVNQISRRCLSDLERIGEGSFGVVYKGSLYSRSGQFKGNVGIKIVKNRNVDDMWAEFNRMVNHDHPNVLKLLGVSYPCSVKFSLDDDEEIPWLITEFMSYGDLHNFLRNNGGPMKAFEMVKYAYGIACGMAYLHHEIFPYLVHGDLAARNVFIGPNYEVKVGDFGTGDLTNYSDCYMASFIPGDCPFPLRWMPPENVPRPWEGRHAPRFTRKGDVWAYGVVLFEIWTKGRLPYEGLGSHDILDLFHDGKNLNPMMHFDVKARNYVLDLMLDTWNQDPKHRPNFKEIVSEFENWDPDIVL